MCFPTVSCDANVGDDKDLIAGRGYTLFEADTFRAAGAECRKVNMDLLHFDKLYTLADVANTYYGTLLILEVY